MAIIYNKVTFMWSEVADPETLANPDDWVVNPVFENRTTAQEVGPKYWKFDGNVIKVMDTADIDASETHRAIARANKLTEIDAEFSSRYFGTFTFGAHDYSISDADRKVIAQAAEFANMSLSGGMAWPTGFYLKDAAGSNVDLSAEEVIALNATMFRFSYACFQVKWDLIAALDAALTTSEILAIDVSAGWPVYGVNYTDVIVTQKFINSMRTKNVGVTLQAGADPFVKRTTTTYSTVARRAFSGTVDGVPIAIEVLAQVVGTGAGSIRIQDISNGNVIAEKTGILSDAIIPIDMGTLSNMPIAPTIFEIQAKTSSTKTEIRLSGVTFIY